MKLFKTWDSKLCTKVEENWGVVFVSGPQRIGGVHYQKVAQVKMIVDNQLSKGRNEVAWDMCQHQKPPFKQNKKKTDEKEHGHENRGTMN